jgi:gliding motility-associated-like protein
MVLGYYHNKYILVKKLVHILLWICCVFLYPINAQSEASNWYFGSGAGITFNTSPPSALEGSQMNALEGCASVSNFAGDLLFYTDGQTIWNRDHIEMLNGTGLNANASSSQAALIISKPNNLGIFYVFTVDSGASEDGGVYYSEIDMALDNGFGGVTSIKNILLASQTAEMITAYKSESFEGFWVVTHKMFTNEYLTFSIDESGVTTEPIISASGANFEDPVGQLKISPQGDKIAATLYSLGLGEDSSQNINLSDFNANTGVISNTLGLELGSTNAYGLEFSPNGSRLYVGVGFSFSPLLVQFDLLAGAVNDIQNTRTTIHSISPRAIGSMQIGIDGKIYVVAVGDDYLDVIDNPNELGEDCNYIEGAIYLGGNVGMFGLPQFVQSLFSNKIINETACVETEVNFAMFNTNIDSVIWDFGDPSSGTNNSSFIFNPQHSYTSTGTYTISVTIQVNGAEFEYSKNISVLPNPEVTETVELVQCDNDMDGISVFNLTEANEIISEDYANLIFTYFTSEEAAELDTAEAQITEIYNYANTNSLTDTVYARVENTKGCYEIVEMILTVVPNLIPQGFMLNYETCDDDISDTDNTDGIAIFDFSAATSVIESLFINQDIIVSYYANELDALSEEDEILNPDQYSNASSPFTQKIWVRIDGTNGNNCIGYGEFITLTAITSNITDTAILDEYIICLDTDENIINNDDSNLPIDTYLSTNNYEFQWYNGSIENVISSPSTTIIIGEESSHYNPENEGHYTVHVTDINTGCGFWDTTEVIASYPPESININQTSPFFSPRNSINVNVTGSGDYVFRIDSGEWQTSNIFNNVLRGEHVISVKDVLGCGVIDKSFSVIGYPLFFTPNSDGVNDFWMINPGENLVIKTVLIFDRYGKLLTELKGSDSWDGTFNGKRLPTNGFWCSISYYNTDDFIEKKYLGHFTLKR